jgi:hypothetical protein
MGNPTPTALLKIIMERDGGLCQKCGGRGSDIHHIVPAGLGGKRKHLEANLITLCLEHHMLCHSNKDMKNWCVQWSRERYGDTVDRLLKSKWEVSV